MLLLDTCALLMLTGRREDCDRIIIATASEHRMPIITADQIIPQYPGIKVIW